MIARPATDLVVRDGEERDDPTVARLFAALHAFNADLEPRFALGGDWPGLLATHLATVRCTGAGATLLAEERGAVVGMVMLESHTDSPLYAHRHWAEIVALYVEPDARRSGVARALVDAAGAWAVAHGFAETRLYVTAANGRAREFYRTCGFAPLQEIWALTHRPADGQPPAVNLACEAAWGVDGAGFAGHHHPLEHGDGAVNERP
jgi:ribosomal protein S18 acetylase RimI-like enzyme